MPPFLIPGQKVSVVAPSGVIGIEQLEKLELGIKIWRDRGYEVIVPDFPSWGYLAGTDLQRRSQLLTAWQDPEIKAILVARGGYGIARLLENWQWQALPHKWLIGFSDVTALLWGMASHGLEGGLHGSVLLTLGQQPDWAIAQMFDWLEGKITEITLSGEGWSKGTVQGRLLPGNLNLATHLIGTGLIPAWQHIILALEDIAEPPYKVDRMLTQWRMAGLFTQIKGIALGRFSFISSDRPSLTMEEVLRDRLSDLNIPIVANLPFGHQGENATLPVGCNVLLDGDLGKLKLTRK
jgi:muramoyltetrapeptide carboxypeptidase